MDNIDYHKEHRWEFPITYTLPVVCDQASLVEMDQMV